MPAWIDIGDVIQTDAGLTASLYRMLAKPIYGLRRPPETVAQAISLVGLTTVAELVKGISLERAIYGESKFYPWFWERANDIAAYAAAIAWKQRTACNLFPGARQTGGPVHGLRRADPDPAHRKYEYAFITANGYRLAECARGGQTLRHRPRRGRLHGRALLETAGLCLPGRALASRCDQRQRQSATLVAILQTAQHIYNLNAMKDDSDWATQEATALQEIGVASEGHARVRGRYPKGAAAGGGGFQRMFAGVVGAGGDQRHVQAPAEARGFLCAVTRTASLLCAPRNQRGQCRVASSNSVIGPGHQASRRAASAAGSGSR
jgi:hypothetical protein